MRIWSIHPGLLDSKGLVAAWRETLLAQSCIIKGSGGYANHSQLIRFKEHEAPLEAVCSVLWDLAEEADRRGYNFNTDKIHEYASEKLTVTSGQLEYELDHLYVKLCKRDPEAAEELSWLRDRCDPEDLIGPSFLPVDGHVESWEVIKGLDKAANG